MTTRVMEITAPASVTEKLYFHSMQCVETVNEVSQFEIVVLAESASVDPVQILGKNVTVRLELPGNQSRYFDTCVVEFGLTGTVGRYYSYAITGRSWDWFLTRTTDCRVFQHQTVPDIIEAIFSKYDIAKFRSELTGNYREWNYCVQYRETDLNFVRRLMEHEGLYAFFVHEAGKHTLILADSPKAHESFAGYETIPYIPHDQSAKIESEYFTSWRFNNAVQPGKYSLNSFDFEKPSVSLLAKAGNPRPHDQAQFEHYDYPGAYTEFSDGDQYTRTRFDELHSRFGRSGGNGNARGLATGHLFNLSGHPRSDQNRQYMVLSSTISMTNNDYETSGGAGSSYSVSCSVIDAKEHFRPTRKTPKPHVQGPQTAIVVGPAGDEIYTDKYGRVKVQFHWDRYGKKDENASCWVRVSHPWAGKNWGMVAIPRIGQEVVIDFLEGDPDQPLITGRVYNAAQMPPYGLPDNKTQTGILTRSTMDGTAANANEIRFEDLKGSEHLLIHAEKDQMIEVEHDETHWVGHDRTKTIDHDETSHIKHDRTETVDNNETITIGVNRTEKVGKDEDITIGVNRTEKVGSNEDITIGVDRSEKVGSNETIHIGRNQNVTIGGNRVVQVHQNKMETVLMGKMENVLLAKMLNIGAAYITEVGGIKRTTVGMSRHLTVHDSQTTEIAKTYTTTVGEKYELTVAKAAHLYMDAQSILLQIGGAKIVLEANGTITIDGEALVLKGVKIINADAKKIDLN